MKTFNDYMEAVHEVSGASRQKWTLWMRNTGGSSLIRANMEIPEEIEQKLNEIFQDLNIKKDKSFYDLIQEHMKTGDNNVYDQYKKHRGDNLTLILHASEHQIKELCQEIIRRKVMGDRYLQKIFISNYYHARYEYVIGFESAIAGFNYVKYKV